MVRPTDVRPLWPVNPNVRQQFQELYEELIEHLSLFVDAKDWRSF